MIFELPGNWYEIAGFAERKEYHDMESLESKVFLMKSLLSFIMFISEIHIYLKSAMQETSIKEKVKVWENNQIYEEPNINWKTQCLSSDWEEEKPKYEH